MASSARLISAIAALLWPVLVIGLFFYFRRELRSIFLAVAEKIRLATDVKLLSLEIRGVAFEQFRDVARRDSHYSYRAASEEEYTQRDHLYQESHSLFVVHTIKPNLDPDYIGGRRVFNLSVFLLAHGDKREFESVEKV
jgi:hypothetical protein